MMWRGRKGDMEGVLWLDSTLMIDERSWMEQTVHRFL